MNFYPITSKKIQQKSNITQYEDIISKYLHEVISDDRLLQLNVSHLYRIFVKYYLQKKNYKEDKSIQHKIIIFLFKYCRIHGKDSSYLFSLIEIGEEGFEFLSFMLCKYNNFIDFNYINKRFYQSINLLFQQQRNQKEELLSLKQMIEDQRSLFQSQITNIYSNLGKIEMQKSIKTITKNQFHNFSFKEVEIPPTVKTIESNAFNGCSSLVQIIIPKKVEIIDSYAFANCSSLSTIIIQTAIIDSINKGTFLNCSSLTQISIPSSVCKICHSSFKGCSSLTQILIPSSVKSIESYAFAECSSLVQILIPTSIEFIGSFAFNKCKSLNQITIPSVNSIENGTFYGCTSLEKIIIPSSVTKICDEAFRGCSSLMKVKIPSSVNSIGSYAFVDCRSLIKITIPLITVIEKGLFYKCSSLSQISIPSSVTEISDDSFNGCSSLQYLKIPSSVQFIGSDAFKGCSLLDESIKTSINQLMGENKRKINELKFCLINTQIPEKYNQMKEELIEHLNNDNYEFDEEKCLYLETIINQFLTNANLKTNNNANSSIDWPINNDVSEYNKTENIKLFEILIWYSQIYTILSDLSNEKDIMLNLFKLIDFDEMLDACEILFSNIIKNNKKDLNLVLCTLNSHAICKLLKLNRSFISDPHRISDLINRYIDREECDTNEISWIYHMSKLLPSDLVLKMPQFKPIDLIFLIVNEKLNASTQKGPLIKDIEIEASNNFLDKVILLARNEFTSFSDVVVSISQAVCNIQLQNYEEIRAYFYNDEMPTEENYRIIDKMRCLFAISDSLEKMNNQQLIFDDLSLLSIDWINNTELLNRFPSMFFWLCKNDKCADQIISKSLKYSIKKDQIPFWLIALRIFSSRNCIAFEIKINNDLSKIINETTTTLVMQYLDDSNSSNNSINYNWLNILITNLPHQIVNFDIKIIHDFLIILSKDKQNYPSNEINDIFNNIFQKVISEIIQSILSNKNHRIIMNDTLNQFLLFPSRYILSKTNQTIDEIKQSLLTNKSTIDLLQFLNSLDILKDMIKNINDSIIEEEEKMKIIFMKMLKRRKEEEIHSIRTDLNKYNESVLSFSNMTRIELNRTVEKLKNYIEYFSKYKQVFKKEGIIVPFLTYSSFKNVKIIINKKGMNICIMLPATGKSNRNYYFYPDEEFIKEKNKNANLNIISVGSIFFGYVNEDADLYEIISGKDKTKIIYPVLIFGRFFKHQQFLNINNELYDKLISFIEILNKEDIILPENHLKIKKILYLIRNIKDHLKVKWSNNYNAEIVQIQLNKLRDYLINSENLFNKLLENTKMIQNKISSILKNLNTTFDKHNIPIIRNYELPTPYNKFSEIITTINPIIQPILLISPQNKIICTLKKLKCHIGPVFNFHMKSNILINIISFIREKISCSIIYENPEYKKILLINEGFDLDEVIFNIENPYENQVIQLIINKSKIKNNEPKIFELKGKLNIQTRIYEPFLLPFEITIELIPLKILLHCFEYKLAEENESLRLCCDKIKSGDKINFEIDNLCTNDKTSFFVELESIDGNEVNQPEPFIDNVKKCLTLTFPYVFAKSRCRFKILISLSQNFIVTINCDFYIFPLNISLEDNVKLIILPDESKWHEKFILSENETPKPLELSNNHHYLIKKSNSTKFNKSNLLNLSISDLPSIDFPYDLSISSLRTFYLNCTFGASILPICIFCRQINNDDQTDNIFYFEKLLKIINKITIYNKKSILSKYINMFIDSFNNCVIRLQQSGIKFPKLELVIPKIYRNVNKHEFIILPKIVKPKLMRIKWGNRCQGDESKINDASLNDDSSVIDDNDIDDNAEKANHFCTKNGSLIPHKIRKEMFNRDIFKGHKILIVMLYDCRINLAENPRVSSRNLFDYGSPADAVQHFGIEIFVVHNYKDAIYELTKQTKPGYCDYYATWVISGLPYDIPLPDGGNQYLVNQFIDCLIQFWRNGGSVVMFSDGDPFTFQTNLFLEKIEFENGQKTQLRVNGNHKGKHYIFFDENSDKPAFERVTLSLNIEKIYEGESISFVKNDKSFYSPFVPLIKDSEDGITILFYAGDQNKNFMTGDIIIDCGFSKLFADIHCIKSNYQYLQNIAGWTFQIETAFMNGLRPKEIRHKAVNFLLNESDKCNLEIPPKPKEIKVEKDVNLIDSIQKINSIREFIDNFESLLNLTMLKMKKLKSDDILKSEFEKLKCRLYNEDDDNDEIHQKISILIGFASGEIKSIFDNDTIIVMRK